LAERPAMCWRRVATLRASSTRRAEEAATGLTMMKLTRLPDGVSLRIATMVVGGRDWAAWLAARSGAQRNPSSLGSRLHSPLQDAPGSYVLES
jgi:hypothetical protein